MLSGSINFDTVINELFAQDVPNCLFLKNCSGFIVYYSPFSLVSYKEMRLLCPNLLKICCVQHVQKPFMIQPIALVQVSNYEQ